MVGSTMRRVVLFVAFAALVALAVLVGITSFAFGPELVREWWRGQARPAPIRAAPALAPQVQAKDTDPLDLDEEIKDLEVPSKPHLCLAAKIPHCGLPGIMTFSDNGKLYAAAGLDGTTRLWETATGRLIRIFEGRGRLSGDGKWLLTNTGAYAHVSRTGGDIQLWDTAGGQIARAYRKVTAATLSDDGNWLVTCSGNTCQGGSDVR